MDEPERLRRRAVTAALSVARGVGLRCDEPVVLSARGNAIVHLAPAPVVARVSTLTAWTRRDPAEWLAREVAVAATAAAWGGPVVPPTDLAHPGPHRAAGLALTLWRHVTVAPERPSARDAGAALAALHEAVAHHEEPLPVLTAVYDVIDEGLAALERHGRSDAGLMAALRRAQADVLGDLPPTAATMVLHGDAHPGNLLRVGDRWLWTDLEEACAGPRAWDLAVLGESSEVDGAAAVRAYTQVTGVPAPPPGELARYLRARRLAGVVWALGLAVQGSARHAARAEAMLPAVLGDGRAGR